MKNITMTLISLLSLSFSMASQAEIYKWTDAKGQVHYSARPPAQKKAKAQEIEQKILMSAGKFDPSKVRKTDTEATDEKNDDEDSAAEVSANKDAKNKPTKQLIDFCKAQRKSLKLLKNNQNIVWQQFGKKTSLTTAQRKAKMKKIKSEITEECKGI